MTAAPDANDVLFGSNAPSAKFDHPGTTVGGTITAPPRTKQEKEWNNVTRRSDGPPKFFPSGDPIMEVLVDVQTQQRDPSIQNDDGIRTIYISGKRMKDAVRDAVRQTGAARLEVGAELHVTFTGLGEAPSPGANQPKEFAVRYIPAAQGAIFGGQQGQPQQAPQQGYQQPQAQQAANPWAGQQQPQQAYQQPAQQQPAQQAPQQQTYAQPAQQAAYQQPPAQQAPPQQQPPAGPTPEQIAGLIANRTDPNLVFPGVHLTPEQQAQVAAFAQPQG